MCEGFWNLLRHERGAGEVMVHRGRLKHALLPRGTLSRHSCINSECLTLPAASAAVAPHLALAALVLAHLLRALAARPLARQVVAVTLAQTCTGVASQATVLVRTAHDARRLKLDAHRRRRRSGREAVKVVRASTLRCVGGAVAEAEAKVQEVREGEAQAAGRSEAPVAREGSNWPARLQEALPARWLGTPCRLAGKGWTLWRLPARSS